MLKLLKTIHFGLYLLIPAILIFFYCSKETCDKQITFLVSYPRTYIFNPQHNDTLFVGQEIEFLGGFITYNGIKSLSLDIVDTTFEWDSTNFNQIQNNFIKVKHIYTNPGIYTILLRIKDYEDYMSISNITIVIEDSSKLIK